MPTASVNGISFNYRIDGDGPPLVMMHGFATGLYIWDGVLKRLAERFKVFRYDHRGFGESDAPSGPYQIQTFVDDLLALLDHFGLKKVDLVGHSIGGRTALLFTLQHGNRVNRLYLCDGAGAPPPGALHEMFITLKKLVRSDGMEAVFEHELFASFVFAEAWKKGPGRDEARRRMTKLSPDVFCAVADAILATPNMLDRLNEVSVPTWVCAGEHDAGPMAFNKTCESAIPNCTRTVISGCGHFPMVDAADSFISQFEAFVDASA